MPKPSELAAQSPATVASLRSVLGVDALEAGQASGQRVYRTWAELSAITGTAGDGAQVIDDAGTHTDPVVGGTKANAGQYVWSASPVGWRWVRPDVATEVGDFQSDLDGYALEVQTSKNLYNPAAKVAGKYVSTGNGGINSAAGWAITAPIPVIPGQQYTISANATKQNGLAFYNGTPALGTYIAGSVNSGVVDATNAVTVTAPAGAAFLVATVQSTTYAEPSQIQVEAAAAKTAFAAYHAPRRVVNGAAVNGDVAAPALSARVTTAETNISANAQAINGHAVSAASLYAMPSRIRRLKAWWQVSDLASLFQDSAGTIPVTAVGDPVGKMLDKSGNEKHFTQSTTALRPILRQDARGCFYLEGDNTQKWMSVPGSTAYFKFLHDGTGGTLGIAAALEDTPAATASRWLMHTNDVTTSVTGLGIGLNTSSGLGSSRVRIGNGSAIVINTASANGDFRVDGIGMHVIASYKTQAGADFRHYLDGSQGSPNGFAESNAPSSGNANNDLTLFTSNGSAYFRGKFYGAAAFDGVPNEAERISFGRYLQSLYGSNAYTLGVGDSHTYNVSYGQTIRDFHPARLETAMRAAGLPVDSVNKGINGNSTANIIARLQNVVEQGRGDFAVVYAGTNDRNADSTVQAAPTPTTTSFGVAAGKGVYHAPGGQIRVNGVIATVLLVAGDVITLSAPLAVAPTAGQAVVIDTQANLVTIGNALKGAGYPRIVMCGQHYLNFTSGGDTTVTPLASNVALRGLQQAAAAQLGALYVDFHAWMKALIVAGTYTQGDDTAWHVAVGNTHLNNTGEQILADAIYSAMQASGWV